jgi:hypothetical protein
MACGVTIENLSIFDASKTAWRGVGRTSLVQLGDSLKIALRTTERVRVSINELPYTVEHRDPEHTKSGRLSTVVSKYIQKPSRCAAAAGGTHASRSWSAYVNRWLDLSPTSHCSYLLLLNLHFDAKLRDLRPRGERTGFQKTDHSCSHTFSEIKTPRRCTPLWYVCHNRTIPHASLVVGTSLHAKGHERTMGFWVDVPLAAA